MVVVAFSSWGNMENKNNKFYVLWLYLIIYVCLISFMQTQNLYVENKVLLLVVTGHLWIELLFDIIEVLCSIEKNT